MSKHPIDQMIETVHTEWAVPKGWWNDLHTGETLTADYLAGERPTGSKAIGEQIALIHSEVTEAYEGHRKNLSDPHCPEFTNFEVELADALIRIVDTAGGLNLRLAEAYEAKMEFNRLRADHLPINRVKEGGKST